MSLFRVLFITLLAISAATASAAPAAPKPAEPAPENTTPAVKNYDEDWYWGFNIGSGGMRYKSDRAQASADHLRDLSDVEHTIAAFDLFFIWPVSDFRTAMGVALEGVVDSYEHKSTSEKLDVTAAMLAFTVHHYFTSNIGDGFFGRADVGFASTSQENKVGNTTYTDDSYDGIGLRLGIGYSIVLSPETRLPISFQWQHVATKDNSGSNALTLNAGLLF